MPGLHGVSVPAGREVAVLKTDGATLDEVREALARIARQRCQLEHDCRLRDLVSDDIDELLDRMLELR